MKMAIMMIFCECSVIMSGQVHAWTDIGQDKSDMETFAFASFTIISILQHNRTQ